MTDQILANSGPVRELRSSEVDVLTRKAISPILRSVVNQKMAIIQILVMRKYEAFIC